MSLSVLVRDGSVGVLIRIRDLSSSACATHLDTHQEGDPGGRDNTRDHIAIANRQEQALDRGGLGGEEVVKRRDGGGKCG